MNQQQNFPKHTLNPGAFVKPVLVGAAIALFVISFFVFGVDNPSPEWGSFWKVRPLIITPLAGAMGGAFYAFMQYQILLGFNRTVGVLISLVVYLIGLWLGTVLGLAGTMWN